MKDQVLKRLSELMVRDTTLPLVGHSNLVFGEGDANAQVLFVGEAPGANEDKEKRPFVGRAGQLLRKMIREIGWNESDVYITNIVKRRPPENRDPSPEEITAYKPYLTRQIDIIAPEVIIPLGRFSMNYFLPDAKITRDQGKAFRVGGRIVVPLLHPAAALRSLDMMRQFEGSFRKLPQTIDEAKRTRDPFEFNENSSEEKLIQNETLAAQGDIESMKAQQESPLPQQGRLF